MDSLPVELLRLIFQFCDPASVRALRITCGQLAEVGYEYLVPPLFRSLPWRNDIQRLHAIATHERLRGSVQSVVLNFSQMDEYSGRHSSFFQHFHQDPEERNDKLRDAWTRYYEAEKNRQAVPSFESLAALVHEAFSQLTHLRHVRVTYTESPHDIDAIRQVFRLPECRKMDRKKACADLDVLISAISGTSLSSLEVDRLPLELFKMRESRQVWFDCGPAALSCLSRLAVTVDPSKIVMPNSKFRAMNGLGHVLRFADNLQDLTLGFHNYANPRDKFALWFNDLFEDFVFPKLTDLKLEGMSCDEDDLKTFLARHGSTLERLHLGGIHLGRGTFKSLFTSLRGRLPKLESVHLHGQFECGRRDTTSFERYNFRADTDSPSPGGGVGGSAWEGLSDAGRNREAPPLSLEFERYLLTGGEYPGSSTPPSPQSD